MIGASSSLSRTSEDSDVLGQMRKVGIVVQALQHLHCRRQSPLRRRCAAWIEGLTDTRSSFKGTPTNGVLPQGLRRHARRHTVSAVPLAMPRIRTPLPLGKRKRQFPLLARIVEFSVHGLGGAASSGGGRIEGGGSGADWSGVDCGGGALGVAPWALVPGRRRRRQSRPRGMAYDGLFLTGNSVMCPLFKDLCCCASHCMQFAGASLRPHRAIFSDV